MKPPGLALIVPCYNEATRLDTRAFLDFVSSRPAVWLLFVDDGSTDATCAILDRLQQSAPDRIGVMRLETNRGKAEAVRLGILEGIRRGPELVGFWDADLATPLETVDDFLAVMAKRPDVEIALGSRVMLMGRDIRRTTWRHYLSRVFATAASLTLDLPVYDTQCGAKVFRVSDTVGEVFSRPFRSRWIFDVEALARYMDAPAPPGGPTRRARIYEVAVPAWHEVRGGKLHCSDFFRSMVELVGIWRGRVRRPLPSSVNSP
jgi:dolichyl-phosphate beta-glucosyltransferase